MLPWSHLYVQQARVDELRRDAMHHMRTRELLGDRPRPLGRTLPWSRNSRRKGSGWQA